jgi:hypothetical protein
LVVGIFCVSRYSGIHPHRPGCGDRATGYTSVERQKLYGINGPQAWESRMLLDLQASGKDAAQESIIPAP